MSVFRWPGGLGEPPDACFNPWDWTEPRTEELAVSLIVPILVGDVGGLPLRMFTSPRWQATRERDLPWHSTEDLRAALGVPEDLATVLQRSTRRDWSEDVRTVATPDGITTIAPHPMAEGLIDALRFRAAQVPSERRRMVRARYRNTMTAALKALLGDMPEAAKLAFALEALDD